MSAPQRTFGGRVRARHGPAMEASLVPAAVVLAPSCKWRTSAQLQTTGCGSGVLAQLTTPYARTRDATSPRALVGPVLTFSVAGMLWSALVPCACVLVVLFLQQLDQRRIGSSARHAEARLRAS